MHRLDVTADPYIYQLSVDIDGSNALEAFFDTSGSDMSLGQLATPISGIENTLDGTIRELPSSDRAPLCRSLQHS